MIKRILTRTFFLLTVAFFIYQKDNDAIFGVDLKAKGEDMEVLSLLLAGTTCFAVNTGIDEKLFIKYVKQFYKDAKEEHDNK
jgi:hypothetical protein